MRQLQAASATRQRKCSSTMHRRIRRSFQLQHVNMQSFCAHTDPGPWWGTRLPGTAVPVAKTVPEAAKPCCR